MTQVIPDTSSSKAESIRADRSETAAGIATNFHALNTMRSRRWGSPFSLLTAAIAFLSFSAAVTANPGLKNIGQEGCNNGSCYVCEGDCDTDADCAGFLKCFQRDDLDAVPGCSVAGDGFGGKYFAD